MRFKEVLKKIFEPTVVYAHCDIPCGIYDPNTAQIAALTVIRMMDLLQESKDSHDIIRYVDAKEDHAEKCKHEMRVIYGDYFQKEHFEKYPDLHDLNHQVMQLASKAKQGRDRKVAEELLETINRIAEIFWETKDMKTKRVESPYSVKEEIVLPEL